MADASVKKNLVHGSTLGLGIVLGAVLLLFVNYFGYKYYLRADWTASRLYTLSDKTLNLLTNELDQPVQITVFFDPQGGPSDLLYEPLEELVRRYEAASEHITSRFLDPIKNRTEAEAAKESLELTGESVVVLASGDDRRVVPVSDLGEFDFSGVQFGQQPTLKAFKGEQEISGALLELIEQDQPRVLVTTGHGERSLDDRGPDGLDLARQLFERDNVAVEEWSPLGQSQVPEGADLILVAGPRGSFLEPEVALFREFADRGGRFLILLDPPLNRTGALDPLGLEGWLRDLGVEVGQDVVLDPANPLPFYGADTVFVTDYGSVAVARSVAEAQLPLLVQVARSTQATADSEGVTDFLFTSDQGWGETDLAALLTGVAEPGEGDPPGPVSLGVVVDRQVAALPGGEETAGEEGEAEEPGAETAASEERPTLRMVVVGDSDFAANRFLQANVGNQVLFSDTLNWLVEREARLGIPPKEPEQARLSLTAPQIRQVYLLALAVLPLASIVLGVVLYTRRRR
jgi:hypothetical protein